MSKVRRSKPPRHAAKAPVNAAPASPTEASSVTDQTALEAPSPGDSEAPAADVVIHASEIAETAAETAAPLEAAIPEEPVTMTAPSDAAAPVESREAIEPAIKVFAQTADTLADIAETTTEFVAETASPVPAIVDALPATGAPLVATPRLQAETVGTAVMNYFIAEGEAFAAHMRALAKARNMADIVRLQIGEFQRGADAMLSCWGLLTVAAGRTVASR